MTASRCLLPKAGCAYLPFGTAKSEPTPSCTSSPFPSPIPSTPKQPLPYLENRILATITGSPTHTKHNSKVPRLKQIAVFLPVYKRLYSCKNTDPAPVAPANLTNAVHQLAEMVQTKNPVLKSELDRVGVARFELATFLTAVRTR